MESSHFFLFVCVLLGLNVAFNISGHIVRVPSCATGAGPSCCCAIYWCGTSHLKLNYCNLRFNWPRKALLDLPHIKCTFYFNAISVAFSVKLCRKMFLTLLPNYGSLYSLAESFHYTKVTHENLFHVNSSIYDICDIHCIYTKTKNSCINIQNMIYTIYIEYISKILIERQNLLAD